LWHVVKRFFDDIHMNKGIYIYHIYKGISSESDPVHLGKILAQQTSLPMAVRTCLNPWLLK
jgi:hypothetical protein